MNLELIVSSSGNPVTQPERVLFGGYLVTLLLSSKCLALSASAFLTFLCALFFFLHPSPQEHALVFFCYIMDQMYTAGLGFQPRRWDGDSDHLQRRALWISPAGRGLLGASLCRKWDVLSSDTKRMATTSSRDNSVVWPD